ncbi:HalOD1 output domain-containing protein [Natronomonas marina]|jgi:hypothetical protein|uniref:HalOD1 output domain-containing protein n=1 Tax=Natronomonas marina TaxID=2961939 RepID=UPI0020C9E2FB|nr:HalOD1 output domain-containing protein [Natronomonas marina]
MTHPTEQKTEQGDGNAARFDFDPSTDDVVVRIVEAIDEVGATDGVGQDRVLHDAIDPDALRQCLDTGGADAEVSFRFGPYSVTAAGEGEIVVAR